MKKIFTLFAVALAFCSTTAFADSVVVNPTVAKIHAGEADATHYDATATSWTITQSKISNGAFANQNRNYGGTYLALVKFDAFQALFGKKLTKATLKFTSKCTVSGKNSNIYVAPIKTDWDPAKITWNNGNNSATLGATSYVDAGNFKGEKAATMDVTEALKNAADTVIAYAFYTATGREQLLSKVSLELEYVEADASANFTIKYMCGGAEVKESRVETGTKGAVSVISDADKADFIAGSKKYIYVNDNAGEVTVAADGSSVVTVNFREASTFNYSIVTDKGLTVASGSSFEGEKPTVGYPRYALSKADSVLYQAGPTNKEYRKEITMDEDNKSVVIAYNKESVNKVVFYTEGEDISGTTPVTHDNVAVRASKAGAVKTSEDVAITMLPAGKYKIHVGCFTSAKEFADKVINLGIGDKVIGFTCSAVNLSEVCSDEIVLSKTKTLKYLAEGSGDNAALDYLYIEKTGNVVESNGEDFIPGDGPTYDPDKAPEGGIESATRPEHGMATSPSDTTQNDNTNGTATGINGAEAEAQIVSIVNVNGAKVNSLQKGINIVTYSNGKRVKIMK